MNRWFHNLLVLLVLATVMAAEFGSAIQQESSAQGKTKAKPSKRSRGAIGQGFEIHKIDLLSKQLEATGAKVFQKLPYDKCIVDGKLGVTQKDDTFYSSTESLYKSVSTNTKVGATLQSAYTLEVSVSAVSNNIVSGNTEISGLSLNLKAQSLSHALKKDCINEQPLAKELVKDFEALEKKIQKPWLSQSWRKYKVFLEKYGSHIVKDVVSGSSIYQYVFAKSSEKFSEQAFTAKACVSLAGPTEAGKVGVSACSEVSKKEIETSSEKSMVKKMVVRGGKAATRADLTGELSKEKINEFLQEGQSDPSPIAYTFYPIWTILKARYVGNEYFANAVNLEQFYKGFLNFGCPHKETSNGKAELQRFELSKDSDPEAPTYVCKLGPRGCRDDEDCHYEWVRWCSCSGESCIRYKDEKLNSGTTKKEAYAETQSGWEGPGCKKSWASCYCGDPRKNWEESWSGESNDALLDVHSMLLAKRRRDRVHGNSTLSG